MAQNGSEDVWYHFITHLITENLCFGWPNVSHWFPALCVRTCPIEVPLFPLIDLCMEPFQTRPREVSRSAKNFHLFSTDNFIRKLLLTWGTFPLEMNNQMYGWTGEDMVYEAGTSGHYEEWSETILYAVFWDVAPSGSSYNQRFGWIYRLNLQGGKSPRDRKSINIVTVNFVFTQLHFRPWRWRRHVFPKHGF
jgi:hypothetical protein